MSRLGEIQKVASANLSYEELLRLATANPEWAANRIKYEREQQAYLLDLVERLRGTLGDMLETVECLIEKIDDDYSGIGPRECVFCGREDASDKHLEDCPVVAATKLLAEAGVT